VELNTETTFFLFFTHSYASFPETAEPVGHCVSSWCRIQNSSTTPFSFFENFLAISRRIAGWNIFSHNSDFNIKENDEHCLDLGF
jgi:hypothetical protein